MARSKKPVPPNTMKSRKRKFGVYRIGDGKYTAQVYKKKTRHYLGTFETENDAANAVDRSIIHLGLNPKNLNFLSKNIDEYNKKNRTTYPNYSDKVKSDADADQSKIDFKAILSRLEQKENIIKKKQTLILMLREMATLLEDKDESEVIRMNNINTSITKSSAKKTAITQCCQKVSEYAFLFWQKADAFLKKCNGNEVCNVLQNAESFLTDVIEIQNEIDKLKMDTWSCDVNTNSTKRPKITLPIVRRIIETSVNLPDECAESLDIFTEVKQMYDSPMFIKNGNSKIASLGSEKFLTTKLNECEEDVIQLIYNFTCNRTLLNKILNLFKRVNEEIIDKVKKDGPSKDSVTHSFRILNTMYEHSKNGFVFSLMASKPTDELKNLIP